MDKRLGKGVFVALLRQPVLWVDAFRTALALRGGPDYMEWRLHTAYGAATAVDSTDLVHYLLWQRQMRRLAKWGTVA